MNITEHTVCLECHQVVTFDPYMNSSFFQCPCHDLDVLDTTIEEDIVSDEDTDEYSETEDDNTRY
jgi:hypothetical protein